MVTYQHTQSREGRVFLTTDHVGTHLVTDRSA